MAWRRLVFSIFSCFYLPPPLYLQESKPKSAKASEDQAAPIQPAKGGMAPSAMGEQPSVEHAQPAQPLPWQHPSGPPHAQQQQSIASQIQHLQQHTEHRRVVLLFDLNGESVDVMSTARPGSNAPPRSWCRCLPFQQHITPPFTETSHAPPQTPPPHQASSPTTPPRARRGATSAATTWCGPT